MDKFNEVVNIEFLGWGDLILIEDFKKIIMVFNKRFCFFFEYCFCLFKYCLFLID